MWLVSDICVSLCSYLSFSCEGPAWLHGSSSSPQSLLTHRAVEGNKQAHTRTHTHTNTHKRKQWAVIPHKEAKWQGSIYVSNSNIVHTHTKHWAVTFTNKPSHSCWDLVSIHKHPARLRRLQSWQRGAFQSKSSRIGTWAWSTILSRSSSSSMAASCSAVSFPQRSAGLAWVLEPLGMAGTWHGTWTDGPDENTGSEARTGSVSICTKHKPTHTHTHIVSERIHMQTCRRTQTLLELCLLILQNKHCIVIWALQNPSFIFMKPGEGLKNKKK